VTSVLESRFGPPGPPDFASVASGQSVGGASVTVQVGRVR
jgi:hypothetical protein